MSSKRYSRAPQHIKDTVRALQVKALRLANSEPTEVREIQHLSKRLLDWMSGEDRYQKEIEKEKEPK